MVWQLGRGGQGLKCVNYIKTLRLSQLYFDI